MTNRDNHPLISDSVKRMLVDMKYKLPFYGEFNLEINFVEENRSIQTCGVNIVRNGLFFYYNTEFLNELNTVNGVLPVGDTKEEQDQINLEQLNQVTFIVIHEDFHLLFDHPQRTVSGLFNPELANVTQDMIINTIICNDINPDVASIPKYCDNKKHRSLGLVGKNMALLLPVGYADEPMFEELYTWLKSKKERFFLNKEQGKGDLCLVCNGTGKLKKNNICAYCKGVGNVVDYGEYGVGRKNTPTKTFSLNYIFDNLKLNGGLYLDTHLEDTIPKGLRDSMIDAILEKIKNSGVSKGSEESVLRKLRKKKKDYLREIRSAISCDVIGHSKQRTINRPNRRGIEGIKGNKKVTNKINVIWDTSGSMTGLHEKILEYIFRENISINLCQVDTVVHSMTIINNMRDLQLITIEGGGGTILQPGINKITGDRKYNQYNTVVLTDGMCDRLDFSEHKGKVLIISIGCLAPILAMPKKSLRQIIVE